MTKTASPDNQASPRTSPWRWLPPLSRGSQLAFLLGFLTLFVAGTLVWPWLRWAYHLQRAGSHLQTALIWPSPRSVNSLPQIGEHTQLATALVQLQAAQQTRPNHPHAYRLIGRARMAQADWAGAAAAFEQAQRLAPRDPLARWEAALSYEQMARLVAATPQTPLLPDLQTATIHTPRQQIQTPFCQPQQPSQCYVSQSTLSLPLAELPALEQIRWPWLFMHPPSLLTTTLTITPGSTALQFWLGLDPRAHSWDSDGATFQMWIVTVEQPRTLVYARTVDGELAQQGWIGDWLDLRPWQGQQIQLVLEVLGGTENNTTADWFGWGNLSLITTAAAPYAKMAPGLRAKAAWQDLGLGSDQFRTQGDQALAQRQFGAALIAYDRAIAIRSTNEPSLLFRQAIAAALAHDRRALALLAALPDQSMLLYRADNTPIPGRDFRWLSDVPGRVTYGSSLGYAMPGTLGRFWWGGQALALVQVTDPGSYRLQVRVQESAPAPIKLAVGIDGVQAQVIELKRGDDSWTTIELILPLEAGIHSINLWFLNKGEVNGQARNATLAWAALGLAASEQPSRD